MPNRILKQSICTSPNLNHLSIGAERFFYRLLVQCDDYGQFFANPSILRGLCFPMQLNETSEMDVTDWLNELIREKLVNVYEVECVKYLQFIKWKDHQQIRATKPKYPQPIAVEESTNVNASASEQVPAPDINGNHMISLVSEGESAPNTNTTPNTGTNTITSRGMGKSPTPTKAQLAGIPPQILLYRLITSVEPAADNHEKIVNAIGNKTQEDLEPYFKQWLEVSNNRNNLAWLLEWANSGKPSSEFGAKRKTPTNGHKQTSREYEQRWAEHASQRKAGKGGHHEPG